MNFLLISFLCVFFLLGFTVTESFQFQVTSSLVGESGYKQKEILDWADEDFNAFLQSSEPVQEKTEKQAIYTDFPTDYAFVVRNVESVNYLNEDSECFDPFAKFLFDKSKLYTKRKYLQNVLEYYHIHTDDSLSESSGSEACLPFLGKRNEVTRGYWNALGANMTTLTPAHSDRSSNFIWCASGTKYVFLWSPEDYQNLYMDEFFYSETAGSERTIRFRLENVDLKQFPKYAQAKRYVVKLGPNDVLHMPLKWIHHVFTEPGSFCMNMWFQENIFNTSYTPVESKDVTLTMGIALPKQTDEEKEKKILKRWHWANDPIGLRLALGNNNIVKIKNAFKNPERFHLHDVNAKWENEKGTKEKGTEWYDRDICKTCSDAFVKEIQEVLFFFKSLLQNPVEKVAFRGTRYSRGQYLESHTDATQDRVLSVAYHITPPEKWNNTCGGELEWHGGSMYQEIEPSYNTLYLFMPRVGYSSHRIKPMHCGERYSYAGWLYSNESTPHYLSLLHAHEFKLRNPPGNVWEVEDESTSTEEQTVEEVYEGDEQEEIEEEFLNEL